MRRRPPPPEAGIRIGKPGLGDAVEKALSSLGITTERVSAWLGRPCKCQERKEKLNALGAWAMRVLSGKKENAEEHLHKMTEGTKEK